MRKDESKMFGYLRGVTKELCKINVKGREAIVQHCETLNSFRDVISDAAALDGGESGYEDDFDQLDMCILARMQECAERLEEIGSCPVEKDERLMQFAEDVHNTEDGIRTIAAKLLDVGSQVIVLQSEIGERDPAMLHEMLLCDLSRLSDAIYKAQLMARGVIEVFRMNERTSGCFDE